MRIRRLAVPIAIVAVLTTLGGITAGLILARDQAPEAAVPAPGAAAAAETVPAAMPEPGQAVEKNAAITAGNGAQVNGTGGIIRKQVQHGRDARPVIQSGPGGGPVGLPGASASGDKDKNKEMGQGQDHALPLLEKTELKYPSLGSRLDQLVDSVEQGKATAEDAAADSPVRRGPAVAVTIHLSGNVDVVVQFLEGNGGDPRNVGEDYIEAYVPVTLLGQLSEQPGVIRVREIVPPEPG